MLERQFGAEQQIVLKIEAMGEIIMQGVGGLGRRAGRLVKQQIDLAARLLRALGAVGFVSRLAVPRRAAARTSPQPWYARGDRSAPLNGKTSDVMPMLGADTIRESMR